MYCLGDKQKKTKKSLKNYKNLITKEKNKEKKLTVFIKKICVENTYNFWFTNFCSMFSWLLVPQLQLLLLLQLLLSDQKKKILCCTKKLYFTYTITVFYEKVIQQKQKTKQNKKKKKKKQKKKCLIGIKKNCDVKV